MDAQTNFLKSVVAPQQGATPQQNFLQSVQGVSPDLVTKVEQTRPTIDSLLPLDVRKQMTLLQLRTARDNWDKAGIPLQEQLSNAKYYPYLSPQEIQDEFSRQRTGENGPFSMSSTGGQAVEDIRHGLYGITSPISEFDKNVGKGMTQVGNVLSQTPNFMQYLVNEPKLKAGGGFNPYSSAVNYSRQPEKK